MPDLYEPRYCELGHEMAEGSVRWREDFHRHEGWCPKCGLVKAISLREYGTLSNPTEADRHALTLINMEERDPTRNQLQPVDMGVPTEMRRRRRLPLLGRQGLL